MCLSKCHTGECPPCGNDIKFSCQCGSTPQKSICSSETAATINEYKCKRVCREMRSCGKHQCGITCCPKSEESHRCKLTCNKKLQCGLHTCTVSFFFLLFSSSSAPSLPQPPKKKPFNRCRVIRATAIPAFRPILTKWPAIVAKRGFTLRFPAVRPYLAARTPAQGHTPALMPPHTVATMRKAARRALCWCKNLALAGERFRSRLLVESPSVTVAALAKRPCRAAIIA